MPITDKIIDSRAVNRAVDNVAGGTYAQWFPECLRCQRYPDPDPAALV